jgi:hypothetical protein
MSRILAALVAIAVVGCQGPSGSEAAAIPTGPRAVNEERPARGICRLPLGGGEATIELRHGPLSGFEYNSLRAEDLEQAIDTDESTYAIIEALFSLREDVTLTARAQPGVVFPGGARAGVIAELHSGGPLFEGQLRTLLDGVVQDDLDFRSSGGEGIQVISVEARQPFNSMEIHFTNINGAGADIYEFCAEIAA